MGVFNRTLTITEAKSKLLEIFRDMEKDGGAILITKDGYPSGVIIPHDEYESILETLEIISDEELMKDISQGKKDIKDGKLLSHDEVWGKKKRKIKKFRKK